MTDYLKLDEVPVFVYEYPTCSACLIDLSFDGDYEDWICQSCGTRWSENANDGDTGALYEEWSGEKLDGPTIPHDKAWEISLPADRARRDAVIAQILAEPPKNHEEEGEHP